MQTFSQANYSLNEDPYNWVCRQLGLPVLKTEDCRGLSTRTRTLDVSKTRDSNHGSLAILASESNRAISNLS